MVEIKGKYNSARIHTYNFDDETLKQVMNLCNQDYVAGAQIEIMPDCHAGAGCVIGLTMRNCQVVVPNLIGVDIGCGMLTVPLRNESIDFEALDSFIKKEVPSGFACHSTNMFWDDKFKEAYCFSKLTNIDRIKCSIGTLGGGNHFIEVAQGADGKYLIIHSGSRNFGKQIAEYYQKIAIEKVGDRYQKELCYLDGYDMQHYIHDMQLAQLYAEENRLAIAELICDNFFLDINTTGIFTTIHNYIEENKLIVRKGAISAYKDEKVLIPLNMRDGSLLCVGKGNPDWNSSAPHGAGRIYSRSQAKKKLTLEEFQLQMEGVYSTSVLASTLDESPMAYKNADEIIANVAETVDILDVLKPIYNFKAH